MNHWSIRYRSEEIYGTPAELVIDERPIWAVAFTAIVAWLDIKLFRHHLCEPPGWSWYVPVHGIRVNHDDFENTLGAAWRDGFSWLLCVDEKRAVCPKALDLTEEWLKSNGLPADVYEALDSPV